MIRWSEGIRAKDKYYFSRAAIKMYEAERYIDYVVLL